MTRHIDWRAIASSERIPRFEALGAEGMAVWLKEALIGYAPPKYDRWIFRPFELIIRQNDDLSDDLRQIYVSLTPNGQTHFRAAVCRVFETLDINASLNQTWKTLIEFMYLLPIVEAFPILQRRFSTEALDALFAAEEDYDHLLFLIVDGVKFQQEAIPLIYQLIGYRLFDDQAYAPRVLVRLCEIDPDHWVTHMANMRMHIWKAFQNDTNAQKRQRQRQLGGDIICSISRKRLNAQKGNLLIVTNPTTEPGDNWFLDHVKK